MDLRPLTLADISQWAQLIGICFNQPSTDMERLLSWLTCLDHLEAYGLWDNEKLVCQYACLLRTVMNDDTPIPVGLSINMAVHPDYRGQGLIKQVSQPIYHQLKDKDVMLGMGFSNAQGVKVDKHSKGYGYQVIGQLQSLITIAKSFQYPALILSDDILQFHESHVTCRQQKTHFHKDLAYITQRYGHHPLRKYHYGIWKEGDQINGIIVYKHVKLGGLPSVALMDVYGDNMEELLMRWSTTLRQHNIFLLHTLVTPQSDIKALLQQHWNTYHAPFSRNPYYLTLKPISEQFQSSLLDFDQWNLIGGDVL